ncbi:MAG: hypothetical protein ABA06_00225 [Parcubacteria bacterium C7867-001]|nr:MAG: hypothetical protein ABA06_00225 [Parcubacteria bacterium C7867-001]
MSRSFYDIGSDASFSPRGEVVDVNRFIDDLDRKTGPLGDVRVTDLRFADRQAPRVRQKRRA